VSVCDVGTSTNSHPSHQLAAAPQTECREVSPLLQATKVLRENSGIALLCFQTSALERGEGSTLRPGRLLPPGKTRYPLYRRLGGPQSRSGQVWKISPPPGFDSL
jgi:hypothetical protein